MILFHRTNVAEQILAEGFRDGTGAYLTDQEYTGVWFSDRPLDANEGAWGHTFLTVELPDELIADCEWIEEGKPYREWLIPAGIVNQFGRPVVVYVDD